MVQQRDLIAGSRPPDDEDYVLVTTRRKGPVIVIASIAHGVGQPSASFYTTDPQDDLDQGIAIATEWATKFGLKVFYLERVDGEQMSDGAAAKRW